MHKQTPWMVFSNANYVNSLILKYSKQFTIHAYTFQPIQKLESVKSHFMCNSLIWRQRDRLNVHFNGIYRENIFMCIFGFYFFFAYYFLCYSHIFEEGFFAKEVFEKNFIFFTCDSDWFVQTCTSFTVL